MTRDEVLAAYQVRDAGTIASPGKFEGEMLYVPAMWDSCLNGFYDFDCGHVFGVVFDDYERKDFPEIGTAYAMTMEESDNGFVYSSEYETQKEYAAACDAVEQQMDAEADESL